MAIDGYADLSIEVGHAYLGELADKPWLPDASAASAAFWIKPIIEALGSRKVSVCLMVDDYFVARGGIDPADAEVKFAEAFERAGLPLDYVAHEADLADVAADVRAMIQPQPRFGELAHEQPSGEMNTLKDSAGRWVSSGWVSNGDPVRKQSVDRGFRIAGAATAAVKEYVRPEHRTSMALEVQIYKSDKNETEWACPFLAACWQLVRLGALRDEDNQLVFPKRLRRLREDTAPFHAHKTLSLIPSSMLRVEHAVRVILSQLDLDERFRKECEGMEKHRRAQALKQARTKGAANSASVAASFDINSLISYMFAPETFHESLIAPERKR